MNAERAFGFLLLFFLCLFKAFLVISQTLFFQNLTGQINRESVSIVQTERILSGREPFVHVCFHLCFHISQNRKTLIDGLVEVGLFLCDYVKDHILSFLPVPDNRPWKHRLRYWPDLPGSFPSMPRSLPWRACTAQQTAEYISSALVGRHDTVRDHKGDGTYMVSDDTERNILLRDPPHIRRFAARRADMVSSAHAVVSTSNMESTSCTTTCQTLQSHTCINVLLDQIGVIAVSVIVELGEYDCSILPCNGRTRQPYRTSRFACSHTSLRGHSKSQNTGRTDLRHAPRSCLLCRNGRFSLPGFRSLRSRCRKCLIIVQINGRIETVRIEIPTHFGQEFPCPVDRFCLEVIAEGEVSQASRKMCRGGLSYRYSRYRRYGYISGRWSLCVSAGSPVP